MSEKPNSRSILSKRKTLTLCENLVKKYFVDEEKGINYADAKNDILGMCYPNGEIIIDYELLKNILQRPTEDRCSRTTFEPFFQAVEMLAYEKSFDDTTMGSFYIDIEHIRYWADIEYCGKTYPFDYDEKKFEFHINKELKKEQLIPLDYFFDTYSMAESANMYFIAAFLHNIDDTRFERLKAKGIELLNNQAEDDTPYYTNGKMCRKQGDNLLNIMLIDKNEYEEIAKGYTKISKNDIIKSILNKIKTYEEKNANDSFYEKYFKGLLDYIPPNKSEFKKLQILYLMNIMSKNSRKEFYSLIKDSDF